MPHSNKMIQFLLFASLPWQKLSFVPRAFPQSYHPQSRGRPPANIPEEEISNLAKSCLCEGDVNVAANLATRLRRVSEEEFDRIYRHGWEVTNCTLQSRCPSLFNPLENV